MIEFVEYIGDGVYVMYDGYQIWLYTGSHDEPTNQVALEPAVFFALKVVGDNLFRRHLK